MFKFADTITKRNSRGFLIPVQGTATFFEAGSNTLASIYADDEVTELDNPLTATAEGLVQCKLPNGTYDIRFNDGVSEVTLTDFLATDGEITGGGVGQEVIGEEDGVVVCNTTFPIDDSIPQNTEGTEVVTASITPANASSELEITFNVTGSTSTSMQVGAAVFVDSTANALNGSVAMEQTTGVNQKFQMSWSLRVAAGSTDARTYKLRVGPSNAGTAYVNGDSSGNPLFGGAAVAKISVREILP